MQKRNLIIIILILVVVTFGFFYYGNKYPKSIPGEVVRSDVTQKLFPFGKIAKKIIEEVPSIIDLGQDENNGEQNTPTEKKVQKVSSFPVAGYDIYRKEVYKELPIPEETVKEEPTIDTGTQKTVAKTKKIVTPKAPATEFITNIRYVEKSTGNIYQSDAKIINEIKYTNTIIPKIHEAFFGNNTQNVVFRYLNNLNKIQTFLGSISKEILGGDSTTISEVNGTFLPEGIGEVAISPDQKKIFYIYNQGENTTGFVSLISGESKNQVFNSSFNEWLVSWPSDNTITLTTKPSFNSPGYMYKLDINKKILTKVLGGISGLTTLTSPTDTQVLYSNSKNNSIDLYVYEKDTGNSNQLGAKTLPEKCVWVKSGLAIYCSVPKFIQDGEYPDDWYQGSVSFSDDLWKIDTITMTGQKILDFEEGGESIDGINLKLDTEEKFLFLMNKKDSSLWRVEL